MDRNGYDDTSQRDFLVDFYYDKIRAARERRKELRWWQFPLDIMLHSEIRRHQNSIARVYRTHEFMRRR
jgi:hypothetical protein